MAVDWSTQTLILEGHKLNLERRTHGIPREPTDVCFIKDQIIPARSQCFILEPSVDFGLVAQDAIFRLYQGKIAKQNILLGSGVARQMTGPKF